MRIEASPYAPSFVHGSAPQPMEGAPPPMPPHGAMREAPAGPQGALARPGAICFRSDPLERVEQLVLAGEVTRAWNILNDLVGTQGGCEMLAWRGAVGRLFDHPLAMSDLNRAIDRDPSNAFAVLNRAAMQLMDPATQVFARADIEAVLVTSPDNAFALYCLAVHASLYRPDPEALCIFRKLADLHPDHDAAHAAIADCLGHSKEVAVSEACMALAIDPNNPLAHFVLRHWGYPGKGKQYKSYGKTADRTIADPSQVLARLPMWKYDFAG